jgi:hypothetical protein
MKLTALIVLIGGLTSPQVLSDPAEESKPAPGGRMPTPVLIELFTSEGCSSCPPADRLLSRLVSEQPIDGVQIIGLGEHVDYWNRLGWTDRFSSAAFTRRQRGYQADVFASSTVYTPQLVVDGAFEEIGSREHAVLRAIDEAAQRLKAPMSVEIGRAAAGLVPVTVRVDIDATVVRDEPADVIVSVVEDGLVTDVARGENRGRTLTHSAVVRVLEIIGSIEPGRQGWSIEKDMPLDDEWRLGNTRVVAFLQARGSRAVLGAASSALRPVEPGQ